VAEEREHFAGFGGVRADVAADKLVGVGRKILCQRHSPKIKFAREKSELDLLSSRSGANRLKHNRFGWQAKIAPTNSVFARKKAQFRIVNLGFFW
jgi:hypothetical protein